MTSLLKGWLLDPVVLLFLLSLFSGLLLYVIPTGNKSSRLFSGLIVSFWLTGFAVCSSPVLVNPIVALLENQFPQRNTCEQGSHIVVLTGGVGYHTRDAIDFADMSPATLARAGAAGRFALVEPNTRLLVVGGGRGDVGESAIVASYLSGLGVEVERLITETVSLNTYENALRTRDLLAREQISGPVRLITSAMHMPRAARVFQKVFDGLEIEFCPVPVDRQAMPDVPFWAVAPQITALSKFDLWLHEVIALQVYRMRGWL